MAKKKESTTGHASQSFAQMVSKAQLDALKPYIEQVADHKMADLANKIFSTVYQVIMNSQAQTQIRQLAIEQLMKENTTWLNDDALGQVIADIEDRALGLETLLGPAQAGDKVRIEVQYKRPGEPTLTAPEKVMINSLLQQNPQGQVQTLPEIEQSILGRSVGESVLAVLPSEIPGVDGVAENTVVEVTVKRISRKKGTPNDQVTAS